MTVFLVTFAMIAVVITLMSVGVIFGRGAIRGSCGGVNNGGACICTQKCAKRRKQDATAPKL
jgi:hypothetical protein